MLLRKYPYEHKVANEIARAIEAIEEIFKNFAKIAQIDMDINAYSGERTTNIPADVATPFPPLNLSQIGYVWPIMHKKTAMR